MGEMADAIINGECCASCGEFFDPPVGFEAICNACSQGRGDTTDEDPKENRRTLAREQFPRASALAAREGFTLRKTSETHYQIRVPGKFLLDVYPSNQRLYRPKPGRNFPRRAPHLFLPTPWLLYDVVHQVVEHLKQESKS